MYGRILIACPKPSRGGLDRAGHRLPTGLCSYVPGGSQRWFGGWSFAGDQSEEAEGDYPLWPFPSFGCCGNVILGEQPAWLVFRLFLNYSARRQALLPAQAALLFS